MRSAVDHVLEVALPGTTAARLRGGASSTPFTGSRFRREPEVIEQPGQLALSETHGAAPVQMARASRGATVGVAVRRPFIRGQSATNDGAHRAGKPSITVVPTWGGARPRTACARSALLKGLRRTWTDHGGAHEAGEPPWFASSRVSQHLILWGRQPTCPYVIDLQRKLAIAGTKTDTSGGARRGAARARGCPPPRSSTNSVATSSVRDHGSFCATRARARVRPSRCRRWRARHEDRHRQGIHDRVIRMRLPLARPAAGAEDSVLPADTAQRMTLLSRLQRKTQLTNSPGSAGTLRRHCADDVADRGTRRGDLSSPEQIVNVVSGLPVRFNDVKLQSIKDEHGKFWFTEGMIAADRSGSIAGPWPTSGGPTRTSSRTMRHARQSSGRASPRSCSRSRASSWWWTSARARSLCACGAGCASSTREASRAGSCGRGAG